SCSREAAGAATTDAPNHSWALISPSSARMRAGRSGWPGTSCAIPESCRSQSERRIPVPYAPVRPAIVVGGAGAAGLFAARIAASEQARVTLVSARPLAETASYWAQGGAAAALAVDDSAAIHLDDTLAAGRGIVRRSAAQVLCDEAAA